MTLFLESPDESPFAALMEGRMIELDPEPEPSVYTETEDDVLDFSDLYVPLFRLAMEG